MFSRLLEVSWESSKLVLFPVTLMAFGLPVLSVQGFAFDPSASTVWYQNPWLPLFPLLSILTGFALALTVWDWDHRGDHVYSLSLPVTRAGWALEKMSAGIVLLCLPALAFTAGALLSAGLLDLPEGLRAYPWDLSLRFFFASLTAYSVMFALAAGSVRTAMLVIGGAIAFFTVGQAVYSFGAQAFGYPNVFLLERLLAAMQEWPGPLHIFTGDWLLVDV